MAAPRPLHPVTFRPRRNPQLLTVALVLLVHATMRAHAQGADPNTWVTDGVVNAIAVSGNTVILGGNFTQVGPSTGAFVAVDAASGAASANWPDVVGIVKCSASDGAGGWYIGGAFTSVSGVPRASLAHIRADLTLDGWNPGANDFVQSIAVSGSTVYVGGWFTTLGGQSRNYIGAVDAATGQVTAWNPNANDWVYPIVVSGSKVYVGGYFTSIGGQSRNHLAAIAAGTGVATPWNPDANDVVKAIVPAGASVYAGGYFTSVGGQLRGCLAALDTTAGLATSWDPGAGSDPGGDGPYVYTLLLNGSTMYAGGAFASVGGFNRQNLAAIDIATGVPSAWNPGADNRVYSLALRGATVYAGGAFTSIGGQPRGRLAGLDAGTGLATAWNPRANNEVHSLAVSGSVVYAGGYLSSLGGVARKNIAELDATTGQPTSWDVGADSTVNTLAVSGGTLYVGGDFTHFAGQPRAGVASLGVTGTDLNYWNPGATAGAYPASITKIVVDGSTVYVCGFFTTIGGVSRHSLAAVDAVTQAVSPWNPAPDAWAYTVAVNGSAVYVGGGFTSIGGQPRNGIAAVDAATGQATSWNPGISTYGSVAALLVSGSTVYAGGGFTRIGGQDRRSLAALDATTGTATSWDPSPGPAPSVQAMALVGSTLYAGGGFDSLGGQARWALGALDTSAGVATGWDAGLGDMGAPAIHALEFSGTTLYLGGQFTGVTGQSKTGYAAIVPLDASAPVVSALPPSGGGPLVIGTRRLLSWTATDNKAVRSVDLYLSRSGSGGPWELLAAGSQNTGSFNWTVSGPSVAGNNAFLRVDARDYDRNVGSAVSAAGFAISIAGAGVEQNAPVTAFALSPPAPNPVSVQSRFTFALPVRARARVSLIDVQGREVTVLADGVHEAGRHTAALETSHLHAGIYFLRMQANGADMTRRIVVVK